MNAKNMRKSLRAKFNDYLSHIADEKIRQVVADNTIITGGALVSLLTGEPVRDYDVYFRTQAAAEVVARYYCAQFKATHPDVQMEVRKDEATGRITVFVRSNGAVGDSDAAPDDDAPEPQDGDSADESDAGKPKYRPVYLSTNAITLSDKIQIVIRFYGEPEEIHKNYDFVHCTCYWSSWDDKLELPARALESIINKELYYVGSKYPLCSIIRTRKFIGRGWTINAGQYVKMALQLNTLNLLDLDVFADQLVGVDSAFFSNAIAQIKERQEKEPDFKIDSTYLFEIINRIF